MFSLVCFLLCGMAIYSAKVRKDGAKAWLQHPNDPKAAVQAFKQMQPDAVEGMPRPATNMKRWAEQWDDRDSYADMPRSGRPRKITDESTLRACCAALKRARRIGGVWRHYATIEEAAEYEPVLQRTKAQYNVSWQHLLRALYRFDPTITRGKEKQRPFLKEHHREQRITIAKRLRRQPLKYFKRVFYLDAKHLYVVPPLDTVYCDAAEVNALFVEDPKAKHHPICLHYYAMVNWFTGAVSLIWVSGTTGKKLQYVVSHGACCQLTDMRASAAYFQTGTHSRSGACPEVQLLSHCPMA